MKRSVSTLTALILVVAMLVFAVPALAEQGTAYTPGSYTVRATGHNCDFDVTVTFDESSITDIVIGENSETGYLGTYTMEKVRQDILAQQTVKVDVISGATVSDTALRMAVSEAVKQAGGDPAAMPDAVYDVPAYEDTTTQVVVVGSGSAGVAAAVEASQQGMNVILLEQLGLVGGSSLRTGYLQGGGTQMAADAGQEGYTKEEFVAYLVDNSVSGTGGGNRSEIDQALFNEALGTQIAEMAGENIDWLNGLGVSMKPNGFMYRGLNAETGAVSRLGPYLMSAMNNVIENSENIDCRLNTKAEKLIVEDGAVVGVTAVGPDGNSFDIRADAVILCTGGYNANQELIARFNPSYAGYLTDVCKGADGSGLLMGEEAGAQLVAMDQANYHSFALTWRGASRSLSSVMTTGAIAVNAEGKRFVNEDSYYDKSAADAITNQTGGVCCVLCNQAIIDTVCVPGDNNLANDLSMYTKADTLEELAGLMGIDAEALVETVKNYNQYVANGVDEEMGRSADMLTVTYDEGPFYAAKTQPELHTVHGGLKIDAEERVLNADDQPIPGLYAAGEVTTSPVLGSNTNTVAIAQGRIAARVVAGDIQK